jgi:hypothetical protein
MFVDIKYRYLVELYLLSQYAILTVVPFLNRITQIPIKYRNSSVSRLGASLADDRTRNALLARGFDTETSDELIRKGLTIAKLKSSSYEKLAKLGISKELINNLRDRRLAIPTKTVIKVLYESAWGCCVCRRENEPVVIHHIVPWEESQDHGETNLVVLCLNDHARAHRKGDLEQNLTADRIRRLKKKWTTEVAKRNSSTLLTQKAAPGARWDYFNHRRLLELAIKKKINFKANPYFGAVKQLGMVDKNGIINDPSTWLTEKKPKYHLYDLWEGMQLHFYVSSILEELITKLSIIDITKQWNKSKLKSLLEPGTFVSLTSAFYFKSSAKSKGTNQSRRCYRRARGIWLDFTFDAWECTSTSSWGSHLRGHNIVTVICLAKSLLEKEKKLVIGASGLAIGAYFNEIGGASNSEYGHYFHEDYLD